MEEYKSIVQFGLICLIALCVLPIFRTPPRYSCKEYDVTMSRDLNNEIYPLYPDIYYLGLFISAPVLSYWAQFEETYGFPHLDHEVFCSTELMLDYICHTLKNQSVYLCQEEIITNRDSLIRVYDMNVEILILLRSTFVRLMECINQYFERNLVG